MVLPLAQHDGAAAHRQADARRTGVTQEDLIWVRFVPLLPGQAREL